MSPAPGPPFPAWANALAARAWFPAAVVALLLFPLVITRPVGGGLPLGLPRIHGGDEPHYLVVLHSLLEDGDLDVANQYAGVHRGGTEAGLHFAGSTLDHHVTWWVDGTQVNWADVYEVEGAAWQLDDQGHPVPTARPGMQRPPAPAPEFSSHPVGLPLVLAPLLLPLAGTRLVEPAALLLAALATAVAFLLFRRIALHAGMPAATANLVSAFAFLGTPAWFHARTLFCEPFLLFFTTLSAFYALVKPRAWVCGLSVGLAIMLKPPFALLLIPWAWPLVRRRAWRDVVLLGLVPGLATAAVLALHSFMFGGPLRSPQPWTWGNPVMGVFLQWFSPVHGILPFAPVVLAAAPGWLTLWRTQPGARPLAVAFLLMHGLMASWWAWHGGWCFGPRLLVPVLPMLVLGLGFTPVSARAVLALGATSVALQAAALLAYWKMWDHHPLDALFYLWAALRGD